MMKRTAIALMLAAFLSMLSVHSAAADAITLAQTVQAGGVGEYQIEIANETTDSHTYHLAVDGLPDTLTLSFVQDGPVLDTVTVDAGGYSLVTLRVDVPADTAVGRYAGLVTATRDDGDVLTMSIVLNVENTYAVEIVSQNLNVTAFRGQEFTFDITASNTGAAPLTNLSLATDVPSKWVVQTDPAVVTSLDPGADVVYHARVLVPRSQIAIDQPVNLSIHSDQASSAESALTVRVQNSPGYLIAAGVVILIAAAGVVVYFRARGRR